jgi:small GTP-binding protein
MSNKTNTCKVVLLGDSGVGKTCLISRYICGSFDHNCPTTNGASFVTKELTLDDGKTISLDIWDTAGQEKYKSLTKFFYKEASIAILVYDITKKESFINLKQYWTQQLKEYASKNIIVGIAGNKCDLYDKEQVNDEEVKEYANKVGAYFILTSAKNNIGIKDLYKTLTIKYVNSIDKIVDKNNNNNNSYEIEESNSIRICSFDEKSLSLEKKNCC